MSTDFKHGANNTSLVYGETLPALDDPAETFFEASKLHRLLGNIETPGTFLLETSELMVKTVGRAGKQFPHRPRLDLPEAEWPDAQLRDVLVRRRSPDGFQAGDALSLTEVSTLLSGAYGVTDRLGTQTFRTSPSAGALFPLELYCVPSQVSDLPSGLYHYDPHGHVLASLAERNIAEFAVASLQPQAIEGCAILFIIAAVFWRSRFKYGQRGLRFTLMEAGHVAQNLVLVADALGLAARPVGGFHDDDVSGLLDLDAVNEAPLYLVAVGHPLVGDG